MAADETHVDRLQRRLDRERRRRLEAEKIAEESTRRLYASNAELKRLNERLDATNEELRSIIYTVSHDLQNPVVTLLGYLELWEDDPELSLDEEHTEDVAAMTRKARYMQALIQDLLEVSRMGRVTEHREPVDLTALVRSVAREIERARPSVTVDVSPLPVIEADPTRCRQLFTNLVENAVMHGGRDDITVRIDSHRGDEGAALVAVADDGRGIPDGEREAVFRLFHRADHARDPERTGIGLAICRKIVSQLGGSIAVADDTDGATFRIQLPGEVVRSHPSGAA